MSNDVVRSRLLTQCRESLRRTAYTAILAVPIPGNGHPVGVLSLRSANHAGGFSQPQVRFCQTVANLTSLAWQRVPPGQMSRGAASEAATLPPTPQKYFVGVSPQMQRIRDIIGHLSDVNEPVLIRGETGVGKENIARALYASSSRSQNPFVKINCAAMPIELLESELFGYERGAFTGAYQKKPGKFELAHGGTLFLDEIGDLHSVLQAKLLQVLQEGKFARLGGVDDIEVDVWVLAATNKDLEVEAAKGDFRLDLYYRLNVLNIWVPPLRQRRQDIQPLTDYFLAVYGQKYNRKEVGISDQLMALLHQYDWPGNVRELENVVRRIIVLEDEQPVIAELWPQVEAPTPLADRQESMLSLKEIARRAAQKAEAETIRRTLEQTNWNRRKAAQKLGVSYRALQYKIKSCALQRSGL